MTDVDNIIRAAAFLMQQLITFRKMRIQIMNGTLKKMLKKTCAIITGVVCMLVMCFAFDSVNNSLYAQAAVKVSISGAYNVSKGITVTWTKYEGCKGYYIYRKAGPSGNWARVRRITGASTQKWIDTNVSNGKKYVYKVYPYKTDKTIKNTATRTIYRLSTPVISTLTSKFAGSFYVKSSLNSSAGGYRVYYSKNSDFSSPKYKDISGVKTLSKTIQNLTCDKDYFVKIRVYKIVNGKKYYSGYSSVKKVHTGMYYTVYTVKDMTTLYKSTAINSYGIHVPFNAKMSMYGDVTVKSGGKWSKVKYNSNYYYVWTNKGDKKFNTTQQNDTAPVLDYSQMILDKAMYLSTQKTKYVSGKTGEKNSQGYYQFDCSGFVAYVHNSVLQEYNPLYKLTSNVVDLGSVGVMYNEGHSTQFAAETVTKGTIDWDKARPGDVVLFHLRSADSAKTYNHAAIYLGDKRIVHCTKGDGINGVEIRTLSASWQEDTKCIRRFIPESVNTMKIKTSTTGSVSIYSIADAKADYKVTSLGKGDNVTLLFTGRNFAYVVYDTDKKGFIWEPEGKLENLN